MDGSSSTQSTAIDAATWGKLNRLLDDLLDVPPAGRARWIDSLIPEHDSLKPHLRDLLRRMDGSGTGALHTIPKVGLDSTVMTGGWGGAGTNRAGDTIGPYRLLRELAAGGMGRVWLAERSDALINRPVALKLPLGAWAVAALAERMARERQILASLNHPHIARLYDAGVTEDGVPYLALEYVEGVRIDDYCRERRLALASRLQLFQQVAQAVAHAHAHLVVHRDLKPSNILVTAEGQVRLLDFGIAGLLEDGQALPSALTQAAGAALTPIYASPEQIQGAAIGVASDVYALGVVLCELLTGRRPYRLPLDTRGALEEAIVRGEPNRPSTLTNDPALSRALRGDLDTIVLKALKKNPEERYSTVLALAEDIERHLQGFPVRARPDGRWYRFSKYVGRHRVGVAAAAAVVSALLIGAGLALAQARLARAEQHRAEQVKEFIVTLFADADPFRGAGGTVTAAQLLQQAHGRIEGASVEYPGLRVELLNLVGSGLVSLGEIAAAEQTMADAVHAARAEFGWQHPVTLTARLSSNDVHRFRGRTAEMRRELDDLLPDARRLAETHPELLVHALANVAHLEIDAGNAAVAVQAAREALVFATRALGATHPRTIGCALVLAESLLHGAVPDPAVLEHVEEPLRVVNSAVRDQPQHPYRIQAREIRGRALAVVGRFQDAVEELGQAIEDASAAFGPTSMVVGYYSANIAPYQRRVGDLAGALSSSDRALDILGQRVQEQSLTHGFNLTTRGVTYLAARRAEEAVRDLAEAEQVLEGALGARHWQTLTARFNRAMAVAYLGRFDEARQLLAPFYEEPNVIANRMWSLHVLGVVERLAGRAEAALAAQTESLALIADGPRADWDRLRNITERGCAALDLGRIDAAEEDLAEAQRLFKQLGTLPHPADAEVSVGLGKVELRRGNTKAAFAHFERAATFWQNGDAENRAAGEAFFWLGHCYQIRGEVDQAVRHLTRAEAILARSPLPGDAVLLAENRLGQ